MSQEAITEIDMDVFSRRIGPYFTWLESRIESGWQQNDAVTKDVLKEVKYLATTMRARFILGVSREDFAREVERTVELFSLASEAFPGESDEIEAKAGHFSKGVAEELGPEFLPDGAPRPPKPPEPHPVPPQPKPEPEPEPEPEPQPETEVTVEKPKITIKPAKVKKAVRKRAVKKKAVKKVEKVETPVETIEKKAEAKPKKKGKRKDFFLVRWTKSFIWGED